MRRASLAPRIPLAIQDHARLQRKITALFVSPVNVLAEGVCCGEVGIVPAAVVHDRKSDGRHSLPRA